MNKRAFVLALSTVIIWASGFAGVRAGLIGGYSPGHLVLVRYLTASGLFLLYALWPGVSFRLPKKEDLLGLFILAFIGISTYHFGSTFGQQTVSAGVTGMLVGSSPIFTAIIAVLVLKERLGFYGWSGLFIGFVGIALISLGAAGASFTLSGETLGGVLLILMAALATSIFFVYQKPFFKKYKPIELTAYVTWLGTLPFFIFAPGLFETLQHATLEAHLSAIYVGIFPAAIAYAIWAYALSLGKASSVSSILYLEPILAVLIAWIWLGEWPSTLALIGGMIALIGVLIINWKGKD